MVIAGFFVFYFSKPETGPKISATPTLQQEEDPETKFADIKAAFAIFTNGTFRIFTDAKYHNLSRDVYIEPPNVNIVNVKKQGITWDDFFRTLPMKLTKDCLTTGTGQTFCTGSSGKLKFYLNGTKDPNALGKIINHVDQLLVSFGSENDEQIDRQLRQIPEIR